MYVVFFGVRNNACREPPDVGLAPSALSTVPLPAIALEDPSLKPQPFPPHPPPPSSPQPRAGVGEGSWDEGGLKGEVPPTRTGGPDPNLGVFELDSFSLFGLLLDFWREEE